MRRVAKGVGKIMLVSTQAGGETENCLRAAGCCVARMGDGVFALVHAKRERFDLAVLVSTGKAMDLTETFLALRDIDKWMEIIIVADPEDNKCSELTKRIGAREFANAHVLTIAELREQLTPLRAASV